MSRYLFIFVLIVIALGGFLAITANVAAFNPDEVTSPDYTGPIESGDEVVSLFNQILVWVARIFWIAAAGFLFYAGYLYMFAYGDAEKVTKAKDALIYGIIAIIIGLMAYGAPKFLQNLLEQQ